MADQNSTPNFFVSPGESQSAPSGSTSFFVDQSSPTNEAASADTAPSFFVGSDDSAPESHAAPTTDAAADSYSPFLSALFGHNGLGVEDRIKKAASEPLVNFRRIDDANEEYEQEHPTTVDKIFQNLNKQPHVAGTDQIMAASEGVRHGIDDFSTGMTTPLSVGLLAATGGMGGVLEDLGLMSKGMISDAADIGGSAKRLAAFGQKFGAEVPTVYKATKALNALASAGFSTQQILQVAHNTPYLVQALKNGDYSTAAQIMTEQGLGGGMALLGAKHAFGELNSLKPITTPKEMLSDLQTTRHQGETAAVRVQRRLMNLVPKIQRREALGAYMEFGGDASRINSEINELENTQGINPKLKEQYLTALRSAADITPDSMTDKEKSFVDSLREHLDLVGEVGRNYGVLPDELRQNYVPRATWKNGPVDENNVEDANLASGLPSSQRHGMRRVFETTGEGIRKGYEPAEALYDFKGNKRFALDPASIAADYTKDVYTDIAKKEYANRLLTARASDSGPAGVKSGITTVDENGNTFSDSSFIPQRKLNAQEIAKLANEGRWSDVLKSGRVIDTHTPGTPLPGEEDTEEEEAVPSRGSANRTANQPADTTEENAPAFYLKTNQIIDQKMKGPMKAADALKMLQNNGVKPEELHWTGLGDYLTEKGDEKVTPQEIQQHLKDNDLGMQEVWHGGDNKVKMQQLVHELYDDLGGDRRNTLAMLGEARNKVASGTSIEEAASSFPEAVQPKVVQILKLNEAPYDEQTRYGQYTLPGGENQREMLITLPDNRGEAPKVEFARTGTYNGEPVYEANVNGGKATVHHNVGYPWRVDLPNGESMGGFNTAEDAFAAVNDNPRYNPRPEETHFQSSHWDEPNVLAHVRMNDRTTPDGKHLLHIEELQSDWHQKGREAGYATPPTKEYTDAKEAVDKLSNKLNGIESRIVPYLRQTFGAQDTVNILRESARGPADSIHAVAEKYGLNASEVNMLAERRAAFDEWHEAYAKADRLKPNNLNGVPDAPFKKTWPELLVKRMIRYAAENGYDGISWTPGEAQADRYSLAQRVRSLRYDDGKLLAIDHDGHEVLNQHVPENKLSDYIGKEAARKLMEQPKEADGRWLGGDDLKVGGEGMRGFYDKMVPDLMNNIGKKFGTKVEKTHIGPESAVVLKDAAKKLLDSENDKQQAFDAYRKTLTEQGDNGPDVRATQRAYDEAFARNDEARRAFSEAEKSSGTGHDVQYLPLTDQMRESVLKQGQPLFNKKSAEGRFNLSENPEDYDGYLRDGDDGKKEVILTPAYMQVLDQVSSDPEHLGKFSTHGLSLSKSDADSLTNDVAQEVVRRANSANPEVLDKLKKLVVLLNDAVDASGKGGMVYLTPESADDVKVKAEEYNHRAQKEASRTGEVDTHLSKGAVERLHGSIPQAALDYLKENGYEDANKLDAVLETSAKFLSDQWEEMGVSSDEAADFINQYLDEVEKEHGTDALQHFKSALGIGKDALEERLENAKRRIEAENQSTGGRAGTVLERPQGEGPSRNQRAAGEAPQAEPAATSERAARTQEVEAAVSKTPESVQEAIAHLEDAEKAHRNLVNTPEAERDAQYADQVAASAEDLQSWRAAVDMALNDVKRLPKGVRDTIRDYAKALVPTPAEEALQGAYYGRYRWNTKDYKNDIRHRYLQNTQYGTGIEAGDEDHSDTKNVFVKGNLAIHPEFYKDVKNIFNPEPSVIQNSKIGKAALELSQFAKHSLLSASGFHWVQIGLRGAATGLSPDQIFNPKAYDPMDPKDVKILEAGGLRLASSARDSYTEGLMGDGIIGKLPYAGPMLDMLNQKLFGVDGYIDRMKMEAARKMADRMANDPKYSKIPEKVRLRAVGEMVNNRFGGQNYEALGRSATMRDFMRLALLAPDWFESNAKEVLSLTGPFAKLQAQDFARIAIYNFVVAQTLNLALTGKLHLETPFGVQSSDGKKVYMVRTLPSDLFHAISDPRGYLFNRMNPLAVRTPIEAITGRDKNGRLRTMSEQVQDLFSNIIPIPSQNVVHRVSDAVLGTNMAYPGESAMDSVKSALGISTYVNTTPAQHLAFSLARENESAGHVPSEQVAKFRNIVDLEDRLRKGDQSAMSDAMKLYQNGKLSLHDLETIQKGARTTRLASIVNRLPMSNALDVWDLATNQERTELYPTILKKMLNFQKSEREKLTPVDRGNIDDRLAKVFQQLSQYQPTQDNGEQQ